MPRAKAFESGTVLERHGLEDAGDVLVLDEPGVPPPRLQRRLVDHWAGAEDGGVHAAHGHAQGLLAEAPQARPCGSRSGA